VPWEFDEDATGARQSHDAMKPTNVGLAKLLGTVIVIVQSLRAILGEVRLIRGRPGAVGRSGFAT
jgi:hypothetical protein